MNDRTEKAAEHYLFNDLEDIKYESHFRKGTLFFTRESLIKLVADFHNSQPLNLDVKVDEDWVEVKEPKEYKNFHLYEKTIVPDNKIEWYKKCLSYQQAKTIRQRRDELIEKLKSFEPSPELDTQITHVVIDGQSVPIKDVKIDRISSELKAKQQ